MSNTINSNGNTVGTVTGSEAEYELYRETKGAVRPSTYGGAEKYPLAGGDRVRSVTYPLSGGNSHYIRFSINLNEESKLIRLNQVGVDGNADLSDQNRLSRNLNSQDAVNSALTIATGYAGGMLGAAGAKRLFKSKIGGTTASAVASTLGFIRGADAGASIGNSVGELASEYLGLTNKIKRLAANITLYTPSNIRANYSLNYDMPEDIIVALAQSDNFDAIKAGIDAAGTGIAGAWDAAWDGNIRDAASGIGAVGKSIGNTAGKFGRILSTKNSTVSMLSRTALNVRKDVMFRHVGNRQFVFDYVFAPKSVDEAKEVADIIFMFKYFAHPEMLAGYGNFLYLYPAEFDIEYGMKIGDPNAGPQQQRENKHVNKISSCVLTDISVNYAPGNSFQSLEQGEPIVTTVSLVFREIETLHRERIAKGY